MTMCIHWCQTRCFAPDRLYPPYHVWGLPHANWLATSQFVMPRSYLKSCQVVAKHVPELLQTPKVSHLELEARLSLNCQDRKIIMAGFLGVNIIHTWLCLKYGMPPNGYILILIFIGMPWSSTMGFRGTIYGFQTGAVSDTDFFRYPTNAGSRVTPMQGNIELPRRPCVARYLHFRYWPRQLSLVLRVLWVPWTHTTRHQPDIHGCMKDGSGN